MTYIYYALREGPIGLWSFDSLPLNDSSGYGNNATYSGTPTTTRPIVAGGVAAQHVDAGDTINYPISSIMIQGRESRSFSLEAWIKPQSGTAALMVRDNSGLFLDDLVLRFTVDFGTEISVEYNHLNAGEIYHVVATYDGQSILLFVNGQMVAGQNIDQTLILAGFDDTTTNLKTTMSSSMVMDTPAVYNYALDVSAINRHYLYGTNYPEVVNLSTINGGKYYVFSDSATSIYESLSFGGEDSWNLGLMDTTVTSVDNRLVNVYDETATEWLGGTWTYQFSVDPETGAGITLNGSKITWNSSVPITVETSTDDTTWTPVSNSDSILGVVNLSTGYAISIRITLPNTVDEQAFVDNLDIVFYTSKTVLGSDESLPATFVNPLTVKIARDDYKPASFNDNAGVVLPAGSGLSIPADTDFDPYYAVEATVKFDSSTPSKTVLSLGTASITSNGSGQWTFTGLSALYVDGTSVASPFTISSEKWHHVLAVLASPQTAFVYVGSDSGGASNYPMRVGYLALYASDISPSMADAIYDTWVGTSAIQIQEPDVSIIEESPFSTTGVAFRAYTFDWSITGAG
ncbi:hypothetical protein SEA_ANNADREAMY_22 [Streptomyces phage Annadreamy]|uniref:Uncharacterized protein n=2 Tax=Annadreamyvirus annadreamy TaxID=2846392 RepID=A0A345GT71_9CAUD|nr:hypothetical protein HWB75_gp224 [Streptomyces phage Annadreamy]AXG66143.1 hypothetical protein SEA_ANNADREAMY_22 [Streptomyces phage Annadreamy]QGH79355.1 hypothetical protein SEA_LIMPID_22 [Streptomyces phage Limpid]